MRIAEAYELARDLHHGQVDKAGQPYIEHCIRVAERVSQLHSVSPLSIIAAVLHDAIEDGKASVVDLLEAGVPAGAVRLIQVLSHQQGEDYDQYLRRLMCDYQAWQIKLADVADNADPLRLVMLKPSERDRLRAKYQRALDILLP